MLKKTFLNGFGFKIIIDKLHCIIETFSINNCLNSLQKFHYILTMYVLLFHSKYMNSPFDTYDTWKKSSLIIHVLQWYLLISSTIFCQINTHKHTYITPFFIYCNVSDKIYQSLILVKRSLLKTLPPRSIDWASY